MTYNTATLPNGLRVIHLPSTSPVVYCGYQIAAGTRHEQPGEEGLAHFCEHVTFKGTERRGALQIINALEKVGGELNAYTNKEDTTFYAAIHRDHFRLAVNLLNCTVTVCGWLMWIPIVNFMLAAYTWAVGICLTLAHYIVDAPAYLITLLFSRYDEYAADRYACELGYAQELYDGLSYITQDEIPTGFFSNLWSTHPVTKRRLERIQRYIKR